VIQYCDYEEAHLGKKKQSSIPTNNISFVLAEWFPVKGFRFGSEDYQLGKYFHFHFKN